MIRLFRRNLMILLAILLVLPFQTTAYANVPSSGPSVTDSSNTASGSVVRIKNKWKGNYLYEDSSGVVRYGYTSAADQSAKWLLEDAPDGTGFKRIKNMQTGHYITVNHVTKRSDALTGDAIGSSSANGQWLIQDASRAGYVTIRSVKDLTQNLFIHEEDQLGYGQVSSDIGATWESPQWQLETASDESPVRIVNQYRAGQYLYEDKDGLIEFGKVPMDDTNSHWFIEQVAANGDGSTTVRLKNRATGHYITQGTFWDKIKSLPFTGTTKNEWTMAVGIADGWVTFTNVFAKGTDRLPGDTDDIEAGSKTYVLNSQFDDTFARSNNWSIPTRDNAQWKIEMAADVKPVLIANFTSQQVSDKYLYEDQDTVKYGPIPSGTVTGNVYQWIVEDYNGKKRIRNLGTGNYISMENISQPGDPLQSLHQPNSSGDDQWQISNSLMYDDYVTVQSAVYAGTYIHVTNGLGFAQSSVANPNTDEVQWLFEDPSVVAGVNQYVQIVNTWTSLALYEDTDSNVKYGNVKSDNQRGQWLIEKFAGRKRIKNRATGHYINIQNPVDGHLKVTTVEDSWTSAIWVIETTGDTKQIHSVNDPNQQPNQQKFINVQNLNKYAEYIEIPAAWGSKNWRFVPVSDSTLPMTARFKNKQTGQYLYEDADHNMKYGDLPSSDLSSVWVVSVSQNNSMQVYLKNAKSGYGLALENVVPDIEKDNPPENLLLYETIYAAWASANWVLLDSNTPGYVMLKSGWSNAHYIYDEAGTNGVKVSKVKANDDSALFAVEPVQVSAALPTAPVRIKNADNSQYLFENSSGAILYGSPDADNAYAYWTIESAGGIQRLKNAATGGYMTMNDTYAYMQDTAASSDNQASQWVIEDVTGTGKFRIRSNNGSFNDEYLNTVNGAGYPERGLYFLQGDSEKKLEWTFESATGTLKTPNNSETRNVKTTTPVIDDTNYVRIGNKQSGQYVYEQSGLVLLGSQNELEASSEWLVQQVNGHQALKNRATGHLLESLVDNQVASSNSDSGMRSAQWNINDMLGYQQIVNSITGQRLFAQDGAVKQGTTAQSKDSALWSLEPVLGDAVYELENAFLSGGVQSGSNLAGYSGSRYADHFVAAGARAIVAVNAQEAKTYAATIQYANTSAADQTLSLLVNGIQTQQLTFAKGNGWQAVQVNLPLRAGFNSVSFEFATGDSGHVAIDSLIVHQAVNKAYRGAIESYTTYEAEQGETNGTIVGPSRTYHELANEASGKQAVKMDQVGQFVQFQAAHKANSLVLRYSIPDNADGTGMNAKIGLYVNGTKVKDLDLTSKYAWEYGNYPWSNDPKQGSAHRFFDEIHTRISNVDAGATIKLQVDANSTASSYFIDFAEMEQAPDTTYTMPAGFVSVTDFGAVPNDGQDDSQAFKDALAAASSQHKGVWFPAGDFELSNGSGSDLGVNVSQETMQHVFLLNDVTIRGAGMWYTNLKGAKFFGNGNNIRVYDLAIDGELNIRNDDAHTNGFEGAFGTGSTIQSVWIEHTKTGMWIARPRGDFGVSKDQYTDGFYVGGLRIRNLMADGMNFSTNTKNSMVEETNVRYAGDDGLAMWSTLNEGYPGDNTDRNTFRFDTVQLPWLSNNMVVFGGKDNKMTDNVLKDTIGLGGGITVSTRFSPVTPLDGTTLVQRNTLVRTGSRDAGLNLNFGAIWVYADAKPIASPVLISDNIALDSMYQGISIQGTSPVNQVTFKNNVIDGAGTTGLEVANTVAGSASFDNVIIRNAKIQDVANNAGAGFVVNETGKGFASTKVEPSIPRENPTSGPSGTTSNSSDVPIVQITDQQIADFIKNNQPVIRIQSELTGNAAEFQLPASSLVKVVTAMPDAQLIIQHLNASFVLPADIGKLLTAQGISGVDLSKATLKVSIVKQDGDQRNKVETQAAQLGGKLLDSPVSFEVTLIAGDQTLVLNHFGHIYVTRTLTVDGAVDASSATALVYHPETGEFQYVPALFSIVDGKTVVTIKSTTNSIYTVVLLNKTFADLTGHWAKSEVELLASKLIVNGKSDSSFAPDDQVTRAEFTAMLVRALGLAASVSQPKPSAFHDINAHDWFAYATSTAAEYGLIEVDDTGNFHPDRAITREEIAVMIERALKLADTNPVVSHADVLRVFADRVWISEWAKDAMQDIVARGLMQGQSDSSLAPQALATRAEAAVLLHRLLQDANLMNK
ncbi:S-layer homology domain-containing protein [Paenibacillus sp. Soil787]|uniref:S-layer homology domain-containing protein n=1 Tax=Paenibacillus sp. Soil787 TaxID=1736411 RepID=UPI0006F43E4B|nr:S-layer homology domain-containing protein [Paenibacillus sp. Soil787]KRF34608.1 hypothetical protein ASG93_26455 [Paenibacillus sp. Soil787]